MANYPPLLCKATISLASSSESQPPTFRKLLIAAQIIPNAFKNADLRNLSSCALDGFGV